MASPLPHIKPSHIRWVQVWSRITFSTSSSPGGISEVTHPAADVFWDVPITHCDKGRARALLRPTLLCVRSSAHTKVRAHLSNMLQLPAHPTARSSWTEHRGDSCCWRPVSVFRQLKPWGCRAPSLQTHIILQRDEQMCQQILKPFKDKRYPDPLFNPKLLKWCIVFLLIAAVLAVIGRLDHGMQYL